MVSLLAVACTTGPTKPPGPPALPDVATEPCNGLDDDRDGQVDEGNDIDADGLPDCFDQEECDGLDNDANGQVDDGYDSDGDGLGDCFDTEVCDGVDNDGNGLIDEGFPDDCDPCNGEDDNGDGQVDEGHDSDNDGTADCFDHEECDGLDNDGNDQIDEGLDQDWDGLCDAVDRETCDGWDNDGDGEIDEGFDSGDCWVPEVCNHVDDDGDGLVDEGFADTNGDQIPDCLASCGIPTHFTICTFDRLKAAFTCSYQYPVAVVDKVNGASVDLDMTGWTSLVVLASANAWSGQIWHLADSETCDGFGGDAGTSSFDSEAHNDPSGGVDVFDSTYLGYNVPLAEVPGVLAPDDQLMVQVCQGRIAYRSKSADGPVEVSSSRLFQWDGTEYDPERGGYNDTLIHLGIDRMVADPTRNGVGLEDVVLVFGG